MTASAAWYAVRVVHRTTADDLSGDDLPRGASAYEERITLWLAGSFDEAIEKALAEAAEYAEAVESPVLDFAQAFLLADAPGDGAEVFSLIRMSDLEPDAYVERFFDTGNERQQGPTEG